MKLHVLTTVLIASLASAVGDDLSFDPARLPAPVVDADFMHAGAPAAAQVELGRMLFFDKLLSGNRNTSCATCHHPRHASADGVALPLGEGARGLGPERRAGRDMTHGVYERVPRNSPALFNLGAREYTRMFFDGRVETDEQGFYQGGFITPAKWKLPRGLENVLAAQAMFPVTSPAEMAGQQGENPIAAARSLNNVGGPHGVWELLGRRLAAVPEYVRLFEAAYPEDPDITFVQAANAIAAFEAVAFRADQSPFDSYLRAGTPLAPAAQRGLELFYGEAQCYTCHGGKFQTDHDFHAIAMPQVGPGKSDGWEAGYWRATGLRAFPEDHGRGRETQLPDDNYRFRTPSLRNVAATGPWGHAGSYSTLEEVVRHHLQPVASLEAYRLGDDLLQPLPGVLELTARGDTLSRTWLSQRELDGFLRRDGWVMSQAGLRAALANANELEPIELNDAAVADLVAFLESLSDPTSLELEHLIPARVPSGLPVAD